MLPTNPFSLLTHAFSLVVFGSSVYVDHPNMTQHPLYQEAHPLRAIITPGMLSQPQQC